MSLFSGTVQARDIIVDSAKIRITSGAFITGMRHLRVVNDSGLVNNSGTVYVSGNITNDGTIVSDGVEILHGTSDQTIVGVANFPGGSSYLGNVYRNQPSGVHIFATSNLAMTTFDFGSTDGQVRSTNIPGVSYIRILSPSDTAIKNYSSTRFFNQDGTPDRRLDRASVSPTSRTLVFPVGTTTAGYRQLDYHLTNSQNGFVGLRAINGSPSASPSPASYLRVHASGFQNVPYGTGCTPGGFEGNVLFECLTDHYWYLTAPSGSSEYFVEVFNPACFDELSTGAVGPRRVLRTPLVGGNYQPTNWFTTANVEDVIDVPMTDNFCLYSDWTRTRDTIPGGIYRGGGLLAIATGSFYPLSVEFLNISATAGVSEISVDWKTASEMNADKFEILRSIDAVSFQKIGQVSASGNSNVPRSYQFLDDGAEPGVEYYYQLKQVDYDGKFTLSNVVSAKIEGSNTDEFTLSVYPNPTAGLLTVSETFETVRVVTLLGQDVKFFANANQLSLDGLPSGVYLIQITIKGKTETFKVQKL